MKMITIKDIEKVYSVIKKDICCTPLQYAPELSKISKSEVYLKMENAQLTGSFKIRGVLSKISTLPKSSFRKKFVAASTGNHAAAFAYVLNKLRCRGILFLPKNTSKAKIENLSQYDVELRFYGNNSVEAERKATEHAREINGVLIHPYNDKHIIKGQATIGIEIKNQLPGVEVVLAPVGGGGLVSGLCLAFQNEMTNVIGCQPTNCAEMHESIQKGEIVEPSMLSTISDATSGGIEANAMTFSICRKYLSGFELISEEKIKRAIAFVAKKYSTQIEAAAALPVAALMNSKKYQGKKTVLVLTGQRINEDLFNKIINTYGDHY